MRLEYLKLAQLAAGQTRVQAAHEPQEIRQSLPRVWMNHKQGLQGSGGYLIGELAFTTRTFGTRATQATGTKLLTGSYGSFG